MLMHNSGCGRTLCRTTKISEERRKKTLALCMSHWEHIGYIYQSRKQYRVSNISLWHLLHIQKLDPQIFSSRRHAVTRKKIKTWVHTAVFLLSDFFSRVTWPNKEASSDTHHTFGLQGAEDRHPRTASKKPCDFWEVAEHLWDSVAFIWWIRWLLRPFWKNI